MNSPNRKKSRGRVFIEQKHVDSILARLSKDLSAEGRLALGRCLQICAEWYNDALLFNSRRGHQEHAFAKKARGAISVILRKLDGGRLQLLTDLSLDLRPRLRGLEQELERIGRLKSDSPPRAGWESDFVDVLTYRAHFRERSPFDWIAGVCLPEVYFLFFGAPAKGASFLSFAEAFLDVLYIRKHGGGRYSRKSISRSRRLDRNRSPRRKIGPAADPEICDQFSWARHANYMVALGLRKLTSLEGARKQLLSSRRAIPGKNN